VIFFSKTGCPWCNAVRHLLKENGASYEEREVMQDARFMDELKRETKQDSAPTMKIGEEWMIDTDAKEVAKRLGLPEPSDVQRAS